jgi:hypothetical protein
MPLAFLCLPAAVGLPVSPVRPQPLPGRYQTRAIHANRLAGIRRTIFYIARPKRQAPKAKAKLEVFAEDYKQREAKLDKQRDELRAERDAAIRAAYKDDLPMEDIAEVLDMSHQRVSQIVRS